jgi:hypothetical protein
MARTWPLSQSEDAAQRNVIEAEVFTVRKVCAVEWNWTG